MVSRSAARRARALWREGNRRDAGLLVYESLEPAARGRWAAAVLRACAAHATSVPEVECLLRIAWEEPRSGEVQQALAAVREARLRAQASEALADTFYVLLLALAEAAGRVILDATAGTGIFGAEAGADLAQRAASIARRLPTAAAARIEDLVLCVS